MGSVESSNAGSGGSPASDRREAVGVTDPRALHLSAVSHDVRGGIGGLLLLVDLLKHDLAEHPGLTSPMADVDSVRSSLLELLGVTDRLVAIERFRLGLIHPRPSPMDLELLATELRHRFTPLAEERGFRLEVRGSGVAHTDRTLLGLSAACLLENILKHGTPPLAELELTASGVGGGDTGGELSGKWSIVAKSKGVLSPQVVAAMTTVPDASEMVVNAKGGLGLRLVRMAAGAVGARIQVVSVGGDLRIEMSGNRL